MTQTLPLHADPEQLDAAWFSSLFARHGLSGRVRDIDRRVIGTGQIGTNIRFSFSFDSGGDPVTAPSSVVGKFPSDNEQSRATGRLLGHYRREVAFYTQFAPVAARIAPGTYFAEHDEETDGFALIMEDMAPALQGDQLTGCSFEEACRALNHAAVLHASHWNDPGLERFDWLQGSLSAPPDPITPEIVAGLWAGFKERYAEHLWPQAMAVGDVFAARIPEWSFSYRGPRCLTHGDYRLDNMLFGEPSNPRSLAVVDWQTVGVRGPALDVSYFIGAGLTRADRRRFERPLLEHYHASLVREGIRDYSFQQLYRDYRWFSFYGLSVAFGAAMLVERTERGDAMFLTMARRHIDQIIEHNALALLP